MRSKTEPNTGLNIHWDSLGLDNKIVNKTQVAQMRVNQKPW